MSTLTIRCERAEHANALIKVIAAHGRRFFYSKTHDRVSHFEVNERSRIWYFDDYSGKRIYMLSTGFRSNWRGFSHGGTLRSLVEDMADYIATGYKVPRWKIGGSTCPPRGEEGNVWGYPVEALRAMRAQAFALPITDEEYTEF
jgi:hypothetical protein